MRPDEHKKLKNAQYKKKHGLSSKGSEAASKDKEDTRVKQRQLATDVKLDGATAKTGATSSTESGKNVPHKGKEATTGDAEVEQTFRRRGLASNWNRYDELPNDSDEDLPSKRGEDFSKLLTDAGGAISQFRFRDEEDWNDTGDTSAPSLDVGLDLEDLAISLACVPLHTRLGLPHNLFSEEQLCDMNTIANKDKAFYETSHRTDKQKNNNGEPPLNTAATTNIWKQDRSTAVTSSTNIEPGAKSRQGDATIVTRSKIIETDESSKKTQLESQSKSPSAPDLPVTVIADKHVGAVGSDDINMADDLLDEILAESNKKTHSESQNKKSAPYIPVTANTGVHAKTMCNEKPSLAQDVTELKIAESAKASCKTLELDLDFLLSLDSPASHQSGTVAENVDASGKSIKHKKTVFPKSELKKEDNLEDWLDDMLDD